MSLLRKPMRDWRPFPEFEEMSKQLSRMFGRDIRSASLEGTAFADWTPSVNLAETKKAYKIDAELPGVTKEDVKITLEDGVLCIQGERKEEKEEKEEEYHRMESVYGSFLRRLSMPSDADETKIDAKFKDGMLKIIIPKSEEKQARSKEIAVN